MPRGDAGWGRHIYSIGYETCPAGTWTVIHVEMFLRIMNMRESNRAVFISYSCVYDPEIVEFRCSQKQNVT